MEIVLWLVWIVIIIIFVVIVISVRKVVPKDEVHILKMWNKVIVKGRIFYEWNIYYYFPKYIPYFGISWVKKLPLWVFDIELLNYQAYDSGKIPFNVDITAFFVIKDPELAAKRVADFEELKDQLVEVVKGTVRKILAQYDIQEIMDAKWELTQKLYEELTNAVKKWWVELKNIVFMYISDVNK